MLFRKDEIHGLYRKRAKSYDLSANLYYLIGFREYAYRKKAVRALRLHPGDTVVEVGCGTGLNFPLIQREIGPSGRLIGVDLTDEMLKRAGKRVLREGWKNVELVFGDAAQYEFPPEVNGILSTFALTLVPEYDRIIGNGARALAPGGRWVILDLKKPNGWPMFLVRFGAWITKPFGVTLEMADRRPWESVNRYLENTSFEGLYGGFAYISTGTAAGRKTTESKK